MQNNLHISKESTTFATDLGMLNDGRTTVKRQSSDSQSQREAKVDPTKHLFLWQEYNVEKLTEFAQLFKKNGICLHMSFIFCNFARFLREQARIYAEKDENCTNRIWKDGAYDRGDCPGARTRDRGAY